MADEPWEYARDRFEQHRCRILSAGLVIDGAFMAHWPGLQTLVKIETRRSQQGQTRPEVRYYISDGWENRPLYYSKLAAGHWDIGTHLHWRLEVTLQEDACRVRRGNGAENLAMLRKLAFQLLTQQTDLLSLQKRRVKAACDADYMKMIIS